MKDWRKSQNFKFPSEIRATTLVAMLTWTLAVTSAKAQINALTNGDFETGDLSGWTVFTTENGTVGDGMPDIVYSDIPSGSWYSNCARFKVGRADYDLGGRCGGGIFQEVYLSAGNYSIIARTAVLDNEQSMPDEWGNMDGGLFELLFDGVVINSYDYGEVQLNVEYCVPLFPTSIEGVATGMHEVRIRMSRNAATGYGAPWQYIDDVILPVPEIPEPATLLLLSLGGLALLRKRRA